MIWTPERKREAAIQGPLSAGYVREDTRVIERPGWHQIVTPSAAGFLNEIKLSQVEPDEAERVIDEAIATYEAAGQPVKWCVGPWTRPEDFGERLARRGFESWDVRGMGIATDAPLGVPDDVDVTEIDAAGVHAFVTTAHRGWSVPPDQLVFELRSHAAAVTATPRVVHLWVARVDRENVGTAGVMLRDGYGYLLATQVLEHARGRGIYKALVAARLAFLRARGLDYAVTHAREATSAPILEHLGFETLFRSKCWLLPRRC